MLYRVFPWLAGAADGERGGPLHVPRDRQGAGRHDHPDSYGALYVSRVVESAVAERIQAFRGQSLTDADLRLRNGEHLALARFDDAALDNLVDLDDPAELVRRGLRPSLVATHRRPATHDIALRIFHEGVVGFTWWSTLESTWTNATLFAERVGDRLRLVGPPEVLTVQHAALQSAAEMIGVRLAT